MSGSPVVGFPVPAPAISRGRLVDRLAQSRLGVVLAPAGFGKTVLLAEAARAHHGPVGWYQASAGTDRGDLLQALAEGLGVPPAGGADSPEEWLAAIRRSAEAAAALLVVDDLHLLDAGSRDLVIRLGQLGPPQPRLIIGTRPARGVGLTTFDRAGALVVDAEALRFRSWEVERLFGQLYELPLRPDTVLPLTRASAGWAIALRLLARAGSGRPRADHLGLLADGMFCREYLEREVLAALPAGLRRFLEAVSDTEPLTAASCQALTGAADSGELLHRLAYDHGALHADPDGRTYRIEPVIRTYLRTRLAEVAMSPGSPRSAQPPPAPAPPRPSGVEGGQAGPAWVADLQAAVSAAPVLAGALAHRDPDAGELLALGVAAALRGEATAAATLRRCLAQAGDDGTASRSVRLARVALAVLAAGPNGTVPYQEIQTVAHDAEQNGEQWLSRAARALLGLGPHPEDVGQFPAVVEDCERLGDEHGAALAVAVDCVRSVRVGRPDLARFEDAVARFRALGWGLPEAWARAALAVVAAGRELPDAAEQAAQAEAFARSASSAGARAVALAAVALTKKDSRELLDSAWSVAEAAGLPVATLRGWLSALSRDPTRPWAAPPTGTVGTPSLELRCLGRFALTLAGRELDLSVVRPKAQAVLRLLALHAGRAVHRDQIIAAFWADLGDAAAVHNVQVSVSSLRTFLEPGLPRGTSRLIVRQGESYQFRLPADSRFDVAMFEQALMGGRRAQERGDADQAVAAYRNALGWYAGDLLPEDGTAEWLASERERFRRAAAGASCAVAELELERGRPAEAVEAAMRGLGIDPFFDAAWRLLIRGHEQAGQAAVAARARQSYADILASLGLDPGSPAPASA